MTSGGRSSQSRAVSDQTWADIPVLTAGELLNLSSHFHAHTCPRIMGLFTKSSTQYFFMSFMGQTFSQKFCKKVKMAHGESGMKNILLCAITSDESFVHESTLFVILFVSDTFLPRPFVNHSFIFNQWLNISTESIFLHLSDWLVYLSLRCVWSRCSGLMEISLS